MSTTVTLDVYRLTWPTHGIAIEHSSLEFLRNSALDNRAYGVAVIERWEQTGDGPGWAFYETWDFTH